MAKYIHSSLLELRVTMKDLCEYGSRCYEVGRESLQPDLHRAYEKGWNDHYLELEAQRHDPKHPITSHNPYPRPEEK